MDRKEYFKEYYRKNKKRINKRNNEYYKKWYDINKEKEIERVKDWQNNNHEKRTEWIENHRDDGYYSVYLLPKENYIGQTQQVKQRMVYHKYKGKDISDYQILHTFNTREEALAKEKEYHDKGYNG
jgi:hypothetical protein